MARFCLLLKEGKPFVPSLSLVLKEIVSNLQNRQST
jgi:hypothetical protein